MLILHTTSNLIQFGDKTFLQDSDLSNLKKYINSSLFKFDLELGYSEDEATAKRIFEIWNLNPELYKKTASELLQKHNIAHPDYTSKIQELSSNLQSFEQKLQLNFLPEAIQHDKESDKYGDIKPQAYYKSHEQMMEKHKEIVNSTVWAKTQLYKKYTEPIIEDCKPSLYQKIKDVQ